MKRERIEPTASGITPIREVVWRQDTEDSSGPPEPRSFAEARQRLDRGNAAFAEMGSSGDGRRYVVPVGPDAFGLPRREGMGIAQEPFAAVLGCSDARVPIELVFGQTANDLFVVRVAGNVPGTECVGSMHYAVEHLPSVKLIAVLGHTGCGAVKAAVDAMIRPQTYLKLVHDSQLRAIVDSLLAGVRMAALALTTVHGPEVSTAPNFRAALVHTSVVADSAITANVLGRDLAREVVFGVFDLDERTVGVDTAAGWAPGLADPPADDDALARLLLDAATHVDPG